MIILTLDAALDGCGAAIVADGLVLAEAQKSGGRGSAAALPAMAADVLRLTGVEAEGLAGVAVTIGPGSFTGVRAALSFAHGIGLAAGIAVWGVSTGAAIRVLIEGLGTRPIWVAIDSKRRRIFLDREGEISTVALAELPEPGGPVAVAGDAAVAVASRLLARGNNVMLLSARNVDPRGIARAAARPLTPQPLYGDGPEVRAGSRMRPAPV